MKTQRLIPLFASLLLSAAQAGEITPLEVSTLRLSPAVTVVKEGDQTFLRIDRAKATEAQNVHLFDLENPKSTNESYAILGEVRYTGMAAGSYLETWSHFGSKPGDKDISLSAFSRTFGESGPMGKLTGDSDWRPFTLPFFMNDGSNRHPLKVTFNVQFQGAGGVVEIRNLRWADGLGQGAAALPGSHPSQALAIAGFAGGAAVTGVCGVALWRWMKTRTERELRRIHAADA